MAQIFKKTLWYNMAEELLQEIQHRFSDMDKHATMSLKIRTMMQGDRGTVVHLVNRQELLCPVGVWLCTLASVEGLIPSHASYTLLWSFLFDLI